MSFEPTTQNLDLFIGATYDDTLTLYADLAKTSLVDFSDPLWVAEIFTDPHVFSLPADGSLTLGGAAGTIRLQMSSTKTSTFKAGSVHYWLALTDPSGDTTFPVNGTMRMKRP